MLRLLLKDAFVYGIASICSRGLAIFLLPIYTRVLSAADYGAYDLLVSLVVLVNLVVALEVSQGLARFVGATSDPQEKLRYSSTAFFFSLLMYAGFCLASLIYSDVLCHALLGGKEYLGAFRIGVVFSAVNGIYFLLLNQFRWELRSKAYAIVSVFYACVTLLGAVSLCMVLGLGLDGVMAAQLIAALCSVALSGWLLRHSFARIFDFALLREMLAFSVPLVPAGFAIFISLYINRFALNYFASLDDVGMFGIGSRIAGLSVLLILGIQAALTPLVYQHYREPETPHQIARLFGWFVAVALAGCLFLALFARELLMLFATPEFLAGAALVALLAPALLLSQMYIFAPGIGIAKKTHWQLWITLLSAVVSVVANWLLVPLWGIWGAAFSTLLTSLVFFLSWLLLSQRLYRIPYAWRGCLLGLAVFVICALLGAEVDGSGLAMLLKLMLKSLLLLVLSVAVVVSGLLPVADLRTVLLQLQRRFDRHPRV